MPALIGVRHVHSGRPVCVPREIRRRKQRHPRRMVNLPSFYKLQDTVRGRPCMLCMTQHRGPTVEVYLGYGVTVHLCEGHASREFRRQRGRRDFFLSMSQAFSAAGCYTVNRQKALKAIWEQDRRRDDEPPSARPRPGSYAWPNLRRLVEDACRRGIVTLRKLREVMEDHVRSELRRGRVKLPSDRTLRRWRTERRWEDAASSSGPT